jgi:hypothetical protein
MRLGSLLGGAFAALAMAGLALSACTVTVDQPPAEEPQICTKDYSPVCARRGSREQTFANACIAEAEGFSILRRGTCEDQQACSEEYQPVCGERGGKRKTFSNSCKAREAGFRVVANRACS